jgi:hypothetical protein
VTLLQQRDDIGVGKLCKLGEMGVPVAPEDTLDELRGSRMARYAA